MSAVQFPGLGSGIDGVRIASAIYDELTTSNQVRQGQIESAQSETASLEQMRARLYKLADTVENMRTINGGGAAKKATSSNKDVADVVADSGAVAGTYQLDVTSLAKNASGSFGRTFVSGQEKIIDSADKAGAVQFTVGQGTDAKTISVAIDANTTSGDFVRKFNDAAGSAASASLINVGTKAAPSYKISFSSQNTGSEKGSVAVVSDNPELLGASALGAAEVDQATNAKFKLSGVSGTIERASNNVDDVVQGVSFQLKGEGKTTFTVEASASSTSSQVSGFVDAFNSLASLVNAESKITSTSGKSGNVVSYGSLAKTQLDDNVISDLRSVISSSTSKDQTVSLAALGVSTNRDGTLSFDAQKFQSAFAQDPSGVQQALTAMADKLGGSGGEVQKQVGFGRGIDQEIDSNNRSIEALNEAVTNVESRAAAQQQVVENQFSRLEGLMAKLNSDSQYITNLLKF